jgi:hypothetical protein
MTRRPQLLDDPVLSPEQMCLDGNISMSTWRREYRHKLNIIKLSPRRIGARQSNWRRVLDQQTQTEIA